MGVLPDGGWRCPACALCCWPGGDDEELMQVDSAGAEEFDMSYDDEYFAEESVVGQDAWVSSPER